MRTVGTALREAVTAWRFYPAVLALQAMRGIRFTSAVGMFSELGELSGLAHLRQSMAWLGVTPSAYASGGKRRQASITKTGNSDARKLLIESARSYRRPARVSTEIHPRDEGIEKTIIDRAWDAQVRLCRRYRKLVARGKSATIAVVAVARELIGFIWDIGRMGMALAGRGAAASLHVLNSDIDIISKGEFPEGGAARYWVLEQPACAFGNGIEPTCGARKRQAHETDLCNALSNPRI